MVYMTGGRVASQSPKYCTNITQSQEIFFSWSVQSYAYCSERRIKVVQSELRRILYFFPLVFPQGTRTINIPKGCTLDDGVLWSDGKNQRSIHLNITQVQLLAWHCQYGASPLGPQGLTPRCCLLLTCLWSRNNNICPLAGRWIGTEKVILGPY